MINFNKNIFYPLFMMSAFTYSVNHVGATDYPLEAQAALKGREWYSEKFIPSLEEIEGSRNLLEQIKIRLPLDLERINEEYKHGKPISIAVSCGDRELPWRANTAALYNNPSRPNGEDSYNPTTGPEELQINHSLNTENYISIDPLLGIGSINKWDTGRGAGHFVMDAMNPNHWQNFCDFLKNNKISVHQMLFTTSMGAPQQSFNTEDGILSTQLEVLAPGGKLVEPYFLLYSNEHSENSFNLHRNFPKPTLDGGDFKLSPQYSVTCNLFQGKKQMVKFNNEYYRTKYKDFLTLAKRHHQRLNIEEDLDALIEQKYFDAIPEHKIFLKEMATYFISIVNLNEAELEENKYGELEWVKPSSHTQLEQLRNIIPIYQRYFKKFETVGLRATFITSPQVAGILNISEVKAQDWHPGDYPYGERGFIALVLEKK